MKTNKNCLSLLVCMVTLLGLPNCGQKQNSLPKSEQSLTQKNKQLTKMQQTLARITAEYKEELSILAMQSGFECNQRLRVVIIKKQDNQAPFCTYYKKLNSTIILLNKKLKEASSQARCYDYKQLLTNLKQLKTIIASDDYYLCEKQDQRERRLKIASVPAAIIALPILALGLAVLAFWNG